MNAGVWSMHLYVFSHPYAFAKVDEGERVDYSRVLPKWCPRGYTPPDERPAIMVVTIEVIDAGDVNGTVRV